MSKITEIKSFEDACQVEGIDPLKSIPNVSMLPKQDQKAIISMSKILIIVRAANRLANNGKEWIADYKNRNQLKYEPWFDHDDDNSPSGFRYYDYAIWGSFSDIGSRLCFISREVCETTVKNCIELYRDFYVK